MCVHNKLLFIWALVLFSLDSDSQASTLALQRVASYQLSRVACSSLLQGNFYALFQLLSDAKNNQIIFSDTAIECKKLSDLEVQDILKRYCNTLNQKQAEKLAFGCDIQKEATSNQDSKAQPMAVQTTATSATKKPEVATESLATKIVTTRNVSLNKKEAAYPSVVLVDYKNKQAYFVQNGSLFVMKSSGLVHPQEDKKLDLKLAFNDMQVNVLESSCQRLRAEALNRPVAVEIKQIMQACEKLDVKRFEFMQRCNQVKEFLADQLKKNSPELIEKIRNTESLLEKLSKPITSYADLREIILFLNDGQIAFYEIFQENIIEANKCLLKAFIDKNGCLRLTHSEQNIQQVQKSIAAFKKLLVSLHKFMSGPKEARHYDFVKIVDCPVKSSSWFEKLLDLFRRDETLNEIISKINNVSYNKLLFQAVSYIETGEFDQALCLLDQAESEIKNFKENSFLLRNLNVCREYIQQEKKE